MRDACARARAEQTEEERGRAMAARPPVRSLLQLLVGCLVVSLVNGHGLVLALATGLSSGNVARVLVF